MTNRYLVGLLFVAFVLAGTPVAADEPPTLGQGLQLSPGLTGLLRTEMRSILEDMQALPAGIATANWPGVASAAGRIRDGYILKQKLTEAQRHELHTALPEYFKRLDESFHGEAEKLREAALQHDAQLTSFHYYRMLETCTACHEVYSPGRFPGFLRMPKAEHQH